MRRGCCFERPRFCLAPHLIRIETRAGHGSGKPTTKIIDEAADVYAFLARFTGLDLGK